MGARKAVPKSLLSSALDQAVNRAPFNIKKNTFPLQLKYPEEGYHKVLTSSLMEGLPLLTWSKKVAQWNSKLNGFCYLK